jgi:hypothetical protein
MFVMHKAFTILNVGQSMTVPQIGHVPHKELQPHLSLLLLSLYPLMLNATMLATQSVLLELHVLEATNSILNVVHRAHRHGYVKQMSLDQMNNVEAKAMSV